jgi:hypothetical protein
MRRAHGVAPVAVPAFAATMVLGALVRTAPYAVLGQGIGWGRSPRSLSFASASRKSKAAAALLRDRRRSPASWITSPGLPRD